MSKEAEVKTQMAGNYTLMIAIPTEIRKDSAYEDVGIEHPCNVKVEIYGSGLRITKVDNDKKK